jgi:S1-C subfamily serine protease
MRAVRSAVATVIIAVAGGAGALGVGHLAGWVDVAPQSSTATLAAPAVAVTDPLPVPVRPLPAGAFDPARLYRERSSGVVTIFATFAGNGGTAQGSGFVVDTDGTILTSAHVVTDAGGESERPATAASAIFVEFGDRDRIAARIVGWDVFSDVAVLKVDPRQHGLLPVPLGRSATVAVGDPVAAIGSPFGNEGSLSVGVVSARRSVASLTSAYSLIDAIQTDAPINRGNSGGPLFDGRGRVIGINAQIRSASGAAEGVGFAVPIDVARRALRQIQATGAVRYAYAGITSADLTPTVARAIGAPVAEGAIVERVEAGGGAAQAGLRGGTRAAVVSGSSLRVGGDIIVAIAGVRVRTADDVARIVALDLEPGQSAVFTIIRGERRLDVDVVLGERPLAPRG